MALQLRLCYCTGLKSSRYWGKITGLWDSDDCNLVHDQSVSSSSWSDCYIYICVCIITVDFGKEGV